MFQALPCSSSGGLRHNKGTLHLFGSNLEAHGVVNCQYVNGRIFLIHGVKKTKCIEQYVTTCCGVLLIVQSRTDRLACGNAKCCLADTQTFHRVTLSNPRPLAVDI
jgi:hypothetical protein